MRYEIVLIISLCLAACGQPATTPVTPSRAEDERALRYLKEVEWPKAYREQDTVLLDRILRDDFAMIDAEGNVFRKADEMDWIRKNAMRVDSFRYAIERLEIWPNGTAIVSGKGHMLDDSTATVYSSSNVFIRTDGLWRAISSHVSGVKEVEQ